MGKYKRFGSRFAAVCALSLIATIVLGVSLFARPTAVMAGIGGGPCPNGGQFAARPSGGYTPGANVCGSSSTTQTYTACPDGSFVPTSQGCPSTAPAYVSCVDGSLVLSYSLCSSTGQVLTACPDGSYVTYGQNCSYQTSGLTTCPNGTYVALGQYCSGYTTCPNGTYVASGQYCSGYTTCPNGTYVASGQYCSGTTGYGTCPNGVSVPSGSICPSGGLGSCSNPYANPTFCSASGAGGTVTYAAGWNIVAGPSGTVDTGSGPLYSFPPGSVSYQTLPQGSALQSGTGYWAYFNSGVSVSLAAGGTGSTTLSIPPGQPALVGNPGYGTATVSGAGVTLYTYSPTTGSYQQTNQLAAGQGAWAMSTTGGPITISTSGAPGAYPPGAYPPGGPPPPPPF
jgi:hypothetical protein